MFIDFPEALVTKDRSHHCPWANIIQSPQDFIDAEYLPDYDTMDKEPSHLTISKVWKLLRFWLQRQSSGQVVFRWKSILENGERIPAEGPKNMAGITKGVIAKAKKAVHGSRKKGMQDLVKDVTASDDDELTLDRGIGRKGKKSSGRSQDKNIADDFTASDTNELAPRIQKKHIKPRPIKKSKRMHRDSDLDTAGEDFNFKALDELIFSDDEPTTHPVDKPPMQITELGSLWKAFNDQLPDKYKSWSQEQLQTQFKVFGRWVESEGMFNPHSSTAKPLDTGSRALIQVREESTTGEISNRQPSAIADASFLSSDGVAPFSAPMEDMVPKDPGYPLKIIPVSPRLPLSESMTGSQATASSGGPIPGSMSKYATPRFTNLLNRFQQLSST